MARISAYPKHIPVQPEDYWIGTRASNLMTRNFTAKAVGEYINVSGSISMATCMLFKFKVTNAGPGDVTGVPNETLFSNITSLQINTLDVSDQDTVGFLEYIVGTEIIISEQNKISTFGHYTIDSYTQIEDTAFYTMNLTYIGGNGFIEHDIQYNICSFVLSDTNTTYTLDSVQNGPNSDIRLIGSDSTENIVKLEAGSNVTLTDTGSNILIDVTGLGTVTSIDASIDGNSLSVAGVPITSAGTIAFNWEGTNLQYVDGEGNLQTFPTLPTGTVTSVSQTHAGNAFSVTGSPITTAGVLAIGLNGNATQYIDGAGDLQTFPAIPVVPSNIVETLDTTDSTYIDLTPTIPTTGDVVVTAELSAIDGNAAAGERYLTKTNKWAEISTIPGTYEWEIQGDTGGPTVVNSTDIVTFVGGTNVSTALVGTALTIDATDTNTTYDLTVPIATTDITLLGSDASSDSVTLTGGTNITVTRVSATELSIDGTDLNTTYNLEGVGSVDGTAGVRLAGSDASNDDVLIIGAGTTTVTRSLNTLTVTSNDQFDGTVTNVSASTTGDALDVAVTNPTTTPDLDFTWAGTASQYVDGQGDLQTFPAIPTVGDGTLTVQGTGVLGGTGTFTANQAGNTTISVTHDSQAQTNTTPSTTLTHGGTFTALSANVSVNASGHVTGQELTTFTLPSDSQGVTSVNFTTDGTALNVVSNTVTTSGTMTGIWQGNASQYVNGEGDLQTFPTIPQGDITDVDGGTYITTVNSTGPVVTVNHDLTSRTDTASATTPSAGDTITAIDSVTTNTTGHVEAINLKSVTLPTGSLTSEVVDIQVKNISSGNGGVSLSKGDPVYIYGSVGASARLYVDLADADSTATNNLGDSKMPCVGLLDQDLDPNEEGTATVVGKLRNLITSPIDGDTPSENDTVYVKSGGGLTLIKPAGSANLIQNVGQVGRVSASADGNIVVAALLRSNDVPNLPTGRLFVGTAANTSLTSDVVYIDDANDRVGIGTTSSPTHKLQVVGDGAFNSTLGVQDPAVGSNGSLTLYHDSTGSSLYSNPGSSNGSTVVLRLGINNSEKMRIANNGNVGIGTTSPSSKLHSVTTATGPILYTERAAILGVNDSTDITYANSVGVAGQVRTSGGYAIYGDAYGAGGWAGYFDGKGYFSGNVGIGTTSPDAKLEVSSSLGGVLRLTSSDTSVATGESIGRVEFKSNDVSTGGSNIMGFVDCLATNEGSTYALAFGTGNAAAATEKMRINQAGNVGIGTTSPDGKLHIDGISDIVSGLVLEASGTADNRVIDFQNTGAALRLGLEYDNANINLNLVDRNRNKLVTFREGGNVGIGTDSPQSKLQVNGGVQLANDTAAASASKVGTFRYRTSGNNSYVDICMQTGASTYAWVNIVTNSW
jgi:hypothetical protein